MSSRIILSTILAVGLAVGPGCSSLTKDKGATKKDSPWGALQFWKKEYQQPQKMAVLWSHDVLTVAGKSPTRGFGGRIYFYNNKSQAIPVAGELIVHGFDETAKRLTGAPENQADKRFRFTEEQFTNHFSESDLGASYSVWIPWDTADGVQKEITLVPTFKSSKGELVQGDAAKVVLPGRGKIEDKFTTPVQTVSYQQSTLNTVNGTLPQAQAPDAQPKSESMRTTTIQLASAFNKGARPNPKETTAALADRPNGGNVAATAGLSPASASAVDQARAQLIADAFRQTEPAPPRPAPIYSAWTPKKVQTSSATSTKANLMPATWPQTPANGSVAPARTPQVNSAPTNNPAANNPAANNAGTTVHKEEGYTLPPGIQLSPRGTAW